MSLLLSAVLVFLIELIARGSLDKTVEFFSQPFRPGWTTVALFALILIGCDALFGRRHNGILFIAPITLLLAAIGHQKSSYLGDPLYPADFLYSRQIMELAPLLVRERPLAAAIIAVGGAAAAFLLVALWRHWRRRFPAIRWRMRVARLALVVPALAFFVSIMDFATFSWTRDRLQIIPIMWDQKENYASNGFAIAFALNVPMAKVLAPPSYEDDVLDAIRAEPGKPSLPQDRPDIIMVMSESFWDPTLLPATTITPDPMPTVRAMRSGSVFSPEFGGMTANVEFEALTGFSNAFLPYGSIPYQQYVRGPVPSLAGFLRAEGYDTLAIHPFEGWFWNRENVYEAFGFDRFLSIEKLPPMASRGPLVSDDALTTEIIGRADAAKRPIFTFAVSLQGHGPYEPNRYADARVTVESVASFRTRESIRSFAEGVADADRSLKRLMDWASKRERHTLIVFFGDHLPPLNQGYTETGFLKGPVPERREPAAELALHRETPLVIWSNRNGPMRDVGSISPSLIPLKLFQAAGIQHPYYTGFLGRVDARYDVVERHVLIAPDGATPDWSRAARVDPLINDFRLLQYDALFGKRRTVERFFPRLPKPAGV
ncbi:LTA synthase family protein [Mesorhizobium sp. ZMM04-5]|uniref:LTA synthase family protein n=1 Tax=Mesorhizobium marinum TaxID=3228790 RepID=A0ABV3R169_9HYPH